MPSIPMKNIPIDGAIVFLVVVGRRLVGIATTNSVDATAVAPLTLKRSPRCRTLERERTILVIHHSQIQI